MFIHQSQWELLPLKKLNACLLNEYYLNIVISKNFKLRAKALYFYLKKIKKEYFVKNKVNENYYLLLNSILTW